METGAPRELGSKESSYSTADAGDTVSIPRSWQDAPVFFLGKFRRQRSLAGYSQWGGKESDSTEAAEHTHTEAEPKKTYSLKKLYI